MIVFRLHILQLSIQEGLKLHLLPYELYIPTNVLEMDSNFQVEKRMSGLKQFYFLLPNSKHFWTIERFWIMVDHELDSNYKCSKIVERIFFVS